MPDDFRNIQEGITNYVRIGTTIFLVLAGLFIFFIAISVQRRRKMITKQKEMQSQFQQTLLQTQLEIQEQTFKNISQEIHDNIGQVLSLAKLNINTMSEATPEVLQEKINDSKHLISKAIQDLRDLSKSLNTDYVSELGLVRAVEYELEMIQKTGNYKIQFDIQGKPYRLEKQQELIFFRIVQEALHNIIRHAKATVIKIEMKFEPELCILKIIDDGVGFDSTKLEANNFDSLGLGVRNMYNRAKMINTDLKFMSTAEGTTVILTLPLQIQNHIHA